MAGKEEGERVGRMEGGEERRERREEREGRGDRGRGDQREHD